MTFAEVLAAAALLVAVLAALVAIGAHTRLSRLRREVTRRGSLEARPAADTRRHDAGRDVPRPPRSGDDLAALRGQVEAARADIGTALRNVAVVRYDAFGDMGGRMSFSVALVDDAGSGVVISSIHARTESRTYAKGVVEGHSDVVLTPEEQEALAAARSGTTVR